MLSVGASPLQHRDPLDRLLLAQARVETCRFVTADERVLAAGLVDVLDGRG